MISSIAVFMEGRNSNVEELGKVHLTMIIFFTGIFSLFVDNDVVEKAIRVHRLIKWSVWKKCQMSFWMRMLKLTSISRLMHGWWLRMLQERTCHYYCHQDLQAE